MTSLAFETFEQYVRDCLSHLYDFMFLQEHPLLRALVPSANGEASRVQRFRQIVHEAIEQLKLPASSQLQPRNARLYSILSLRYLKQQSILHLLHQLNLSERQFYRDHTKAVQALSRILWDRAHPNEEPPGPNISIHSEIQYIQSQSEPEQIEARVFLLKTLAAIQGLSARYETKIDLRTAERRMPIETDPMVLRQTLIYILSQLIMQSPVHSHFSLTFGVFDRQYRFIFQRKSQPPAEHEAISVAKQETLQSLVQALGGHILEQPSSDPDFTLILEIPLNPRSLLIVDDNPDAIALFRRYLAQHPYQLLTAHDGTQALRTARHFLPELIILDVMLPKQDGWEILQSLRDCPETQAIPILICSVLDVAELAISLGANGFLRKPPGENEFLKALGKLQ